MNASHTSGSLSSCSLSSSSSLISGGVNDVVLDAPLRDLYSSLDESGKDLFRKIFNRVHNNREFINNCLSNNNALGYYFLVYDFCRARGLEGFELAVLSKLWLLSSSGKHPVNTLTWEKRYYEGVSIAKFAKLKYFTLSRHDPSNPHLIPLRSRSWLTWTGAGVKYYTDLLNDFRYCIRDFHKDLIIK